MGEGLADERPEGQATGREWRTAPLWGIGLVEVVNGHTNFLHDGRAPEHRRGDSLAWRRSRGGRVIPSCELSREEREPCCSSSFTLMTLLLRAWLLATSLVVMIGCGPTAPEEEAVLVSLTDSIIVPGYEALATETRDLQQKLEDLCAQPSDVCADRGSSSLAAGPRPVDAVRGDTVRPGN